MVTKQTQSAMLRAYLALDHMRTQVIQISSNEDLLEAMDLIWYYSLTDDERTYLDRDKETWKLNS